MHVFKSLRSIKKAFMRFLYAAIPLNSAFESGREFSEQKSFNQGPTMWYMILQGPKRPLMINKSVRPHVHIYVRWADMTARLVPIASRSSCFLGGGGGILPFIIPII